MEIQRTLGSDADPHSGGSPGKEDGGFTFGEDPHEKQRESSQDHAMLEETKLSHDHVMAEQLTPSNGHHVLDRPVRRPTRKWAAWTREEEESFFSALRTVGKNFEKITSRVQSKNKDQVRHYYYRLVRRMNKLLGPNFCLNAKNSKDTNAAMLRWWSLLEKYSCKASKLHLKPRRFKVFIEALENQLLKDRKKNVRRCFSQGENTSNAPISASNQGRASGRNDSAEVVLRDTQDIQKSGSGKGSLLKRHVNIGSNCKPPSCKAPSCKAPSSLPRHRRRTEAVSTPAHKRWEKAAIAGVSLVAEAAEHLERTANEAHVQKNGLEKGVEVPHAAPTSLHNSLNVQSSKKLKLQLFPIDDATRRALEQDKHNPYLELTLSAQKKISSIMDHLNRKWGNCSMVRGDLWLFPYHFQKQNLEHSQKWTSNSTLTASDVYTLIGKPPVFRLRYGWFSNAVTPQEKSGPLPNSNLSEASTWENSEITATHSEVLNKPNTSWADSLTNISVGELLSEAPDVGNYVHNTPFNCDSFDAAIAAHINKHQSMGVTHSAPPPSEVSTIWSAEDTCDAFSFQRSSHFEESTKSGGLVSECVPNPFTGFTDVSWPDSLGLLDLDVPSGRYRHNEDLMLSDSLGGLNQLIASSLDAFQSCSFFSAEKDEVKTTFKAQELP